MLNIVILRPVSFIFCKSSTVILRRFCCFCVNLKPHFQGIRTYSFNWITTVLGLVYLIQGDSPRICVSIRFLPKGKPSKYTYYAPDPIFLMNIWFLKNVITLSIWWFLHKRYFRATCGIIPDSRWPMLEILLKGRLGKQ